MTADVLDLSTCSSFNGGGSFIFTPALETIVGFACAGDLKNCFNDS